MKNQKKNHKQLKDKIPKAEEIESLPTYSEEEKNRIKAYYKKMSVNKPPKFYSLEEGNKISIDSPLNEVGFLEAFGTVDSGLASLFFNQISGSLSALPENKLNNYNTLLALMHGIKPKDELEAMLAVQMAGVHNLAMEFIRRSILKDQIVDAVDRNINRATRLLRTFTAQIEALNRYRGKGQQRVIVEHVNVHEGGKAIVGNVNHTSGEG